MSLRYIETMRIRIIGSTNEETDSIMVVKRPADSTESPILEEVGESGSEQKPKPLVKYGELVILGYNGFLPAGERGRRRSKFVLYRRPQANGVRRSKHYVVKTPHSSKAILDASQHSISYTLSRSHAIICVKVFCLNLLKYTQKSFVYILVSLAFVFEIHMSTIS
ncbi:unnamed protein product [Leptidea sinapis]|uniref:Pellino FHA domain-containing protein n=1 Tax=Leptidea sinapis TaxID=189913 RepID=A0A5E4R0D0_9NEOP|nr:unnamed protein product [Leptidea sinapis]